MQAGQLNKRVAFFSPVETLRSPTGGSKAGWNEEFSAWASVRFLRGGEQVMASRMQGKRPAIITVRKRSEVEQVSLDWTVQFDGLTYQVRELPKPVDGTALVELLVEAKL